MRIHSATVTRNEMVDQQSFRGQIKVSSEELGIYGESVHWITPLMLSQGACLPSIPKPGDTVTLLAWESGGEIDWDHVWYIHAPMFRESGCPEELKYYYPDIGWWYEDGNLFAISSKGGNRFTVMKDRNGVGYLATGGRVYVGTIPDLSAGLSVALATLTATFRNAACYVSSSSVLPSNNVWIEGPSA